MEAPIAEAPLQLVRLVLEVGQHLLLRGENALRAPVEREPGLGRLDAASGAVEELASDPLLERANLERSGRLRHPELLGGAEKLFCSTTVQNARS